MTRTAAQHNLTPMPETPSRQAVLDKIAAALAGQRPLIPPLPQALLRVQQAVEDQSVGARELAETILDDPSLTANVLRIANSAFYRRSRIRIRTVTGAIVLLGFEAIRNLALGLRVYQVLSNLPRAKGFREIWQHSICCAVGAHALARRLSGALPEEAFVAGLLHDMGKLILDHFFAEEAARVRQIAPPPGLAYLQAEQQIIGCSHPDAGRFVARQWHFPEEIAEAIGSHEFAPSLPMSPTAALLRAVHVGNRMAHYLLRESLPSGAPTLAEIHGLSGEIIGLTAEETERLLEQTRQRLSEVAQILGMAIETWQAAPAVKASADESETPLPPAEQDWRLDLLLRLHEAAAAAIDFVQFLQQTVAMLFEYLNLNFVFLLCPNREANRLEARLAYGTDVKRIQDRLVISLDTGDEVAAAAYRERRPLAVSAENLSRFSRLREANSISLLATPNIAALPVSGAERPAAVLLVSRPPNAPAFGPEEMRLLTAYQQILAGVLMRAKLREDAGSVRPGEGRGTSP
ncbi:MAG: HDOD domain-containing protein [Planctomycetota bacterium]|nr:HDOD domain-containing protein [Planctomycetota bacterium]